MICLSWDSNRSLFKERKRDLAVWDVDVALLIGFRAALLAAVLSICGIKMGGVASLKKEAGLA